MRKSFCIVLYCLLAVTAFAEMPKGDEYTNSLGMKFVRIEPGTFQMGQSGLLPFEVLPHTGGRGDRMDTLRPGDFDEKPVHTVKIKKAVLHGQVRVKSPTFSMKCSITITN